MSNTVQEVQFRLRRLVHWMDPESAGVVSIVLGVFQLLLSVSFAYCEQGVANLYVLPLVLGGVIVVGGALTIVNERTPNQLLLRGCACSNVLALLVALLAFCLYSYSLSSLSGHHEQCPPQSPHHALYSDYYVFKCPPEALRATSWSVTVLLLLCDTAALLVHALLAACALKTLKTE